MVYEHPNIPCLICLAYTFWLIPADLKSIPNHIRRIPNNITCIPRPVGKTQMCRSPYPDYFYLLKSLLKSPIDYQAPPLLLNLRSYLIPALPPLPFSLNANRLIPIPLCFPPFLNLMSFIPYPHSKSLFSIVKSFSSSLPFYCKFFQLLSTARALFHQDCPHRILLLL